LKPSWLQKLFADYGMLVVLLLLCAYYSWATLADQEPTGATAVMQVAGGIKGMGAKRVLIVARDEKEDAAFADELTKQLTSGGVKVTATIKGQPSDAREALEEAAKATGGLDIIAATRTAGSWAIFENLGAKYPSLAKTQLVTPRAYRWPNFLKAENLLNIANQIAVIAMIAIGMTMVVITAGIDLSVGSLIALSAVLATLWIRDHGGAEHASAFAMTGWSVAAIVVCGLTGLFSGVMITAFAIPPFIATLGMMLVASGFAYIAARGQSIYQVPDSFIWLGRGEVLGLPNAVVLMLALYMVAHIVMTRMPLGRHIYAVGGNSEAARLSGVPVKRVLLLVYTVSGALAGLGGIVMASQLKSGSPTYGLMYELYVIAAVVVGGTSLTGGEGKIPGTLIGALIIAVIQNGMNLTNVESYTQKVVLGLVILGAVLLDKLKKAGWRLKLNG
jgi:ribose transport system permease protein